VAEWVFEDTVSKVALSARLTPLPLTSASKFSIRCFQAFDMSKELDALQMDSKAEKNDDSLCWLLSEAMIEEDLFGWLD
jgi:hypothetical protein